MYISARVRDGGNWGDCEFTARSFASGVRTAARKLGLHGTVLTTERVGFEQYQVNVDGHMMMIILTKRA